MKAGRILALGLALTATPAAAQLSVSTFGASDARLCYENAMNESTSDTAPCDAALRDPGTPQTDRRKTLVNRGVIYNRNGELQAAIDDFNAALASDSGLPEAYVNRGNSYFLAGQFERAIGDYEQALAFGFAKAHIAWYNIGLAYDAKKEADKARAAYEKALDLKPDFKPAETKLRARR